MTEDKRMHEDNRLNADLGVSDISCSKDDSKDNLDVEEKAQRMLTKTTLKSMKKRKKHKSKYRLPKKKKQMHMHKRVDFIHSETKKYPPSESKSTNKIETTSMYGSQSNEVLPRKEDNLKKYKPLVPAIPQNMGSPSTIAERIRAAKRLHMTRRDLTEQKIMRNILMHNNPSDLHNFEVLYVANMQKRASKKEQMLIENSRNRLPNIHHATQ